jgi:hypothetical protein
MRAVERSVIGAVFLAALLATVDGNAASKARENALAWAGCLRHCDNTITQRCSEEGVSEHRLLRTCLRGGVRQWVKNVERNIRQLTH